MKKIGNLFKELFSKEPYGYCVLGGRFEILGNHTDHNHGLCLSSSCDILIKSAVSKNDTQFINVHSKGYDYIQIDLNDLTINQNEYYTTKSLIKGVIYYLKNNNYKIGGFDMLCISDITPGSGVSSSAAFEVMIGKIVSCLFNQDKIPALTLAKAGQYAENKYFNKSCGLLDQISVAFNGVKFIDFKDVENPTIEELEFDLPIDFVLINPGSSHENLSKLYKSIPDAMKRVANRFQQNYLRDVDYIQFCENSDLNCDDLIAKHFFKENKRVLKGVQAIKNNDVDALLEAIRSSNLSNRINLNNTMIDGHYEHSPQEAIDYAFSITNEKDIACKINGGGFAGTIICFIKKEKTIPFVNKMQEKYGFENVKILHSLNQGPTFILNTHQSSIE